MKKVLKIVLFLSLALVLSGALVACGSEDAQHSEDVTEDATRNEVETALTEALGEEPADLWEGDMPRVKIEIADFGDVVVELNESAAPQTVENFLKLVNEGFYNGTGFHRIIDGFMIQGGDPEGTGMGGASENIQGEFANNGVENPIRHARGVISMARSGDPNSASSQFFIMHQDGFFLDGDYAAFGRVVEGMDVVDAIATGTPAEPGSGAVERENHPIMTSVTVVEE